MLIHQYPNHKKLSHWLHSELLKTIFPYLLFISFAIVLIYKVIDPIPPRQVTMAIGHSEQYLPYVDTYEAMLKREGIDLKVEKVEDDKQSLELVKNGMADLALVPTSIARTEGAGNVYSLGTLYQQPLWIFCRCPAHEIHLIELRGKSIAINHTNQSHFIDLLLREANINSQNSRLLTMSGEKSLNWLEEGKVNYWIFSAGLSSPLLQRALKIEGISPVGLQEAKAITVVLPFFQNFTLSDGILDLGATIPAHEIEIVAAPTTLIGKNTIHPAVVYLMMKIIKKVHGDRGIFNPDGKFPSSNVEEGFNLHPQAENFYLSGKHYMLDNYVPFWLSNLLNLILFALLPLLTFCIFAVKSTPIIYQTLIRWKLLRHYKRLRQLDMQSLVNKGNYSDEDRISNLKELDEIEHKVAHMKMPAIFSKHLYDFRSCIQIVRNHVKK